MFKKNLVILASTGEERGRCFTIEYVMPMNSQLTSESTVNVLSRCLECSNLGPWLDREEQGRRRSQVTGMFSTANALGLYWLCWPEFTRACSADLIFQRWRQVFKSVTSVSVRTFKPRELAITRLTS
jgi:hypothetical protein